MIQDLEGEVWKDFEGFEGLYKISNMGRVKGLPRIARSGRKGAIVKNLPERIVKVNISSGGWKYPTFGIRKNFTQHRFILHRIVAHHFIPNPENKKEINHINGIKSDARVENLEWCTRKENAIHAFTTGLVNVNKGLSHYAHKLTKDEIGKIKTLRAVDKLPLIKIAKIFNVCSQTILNVCNGKTYKDI